MRHLLARATAVVTSVVLTAGALAGPGAAGAQAAQVTPGDFTGYGFDQCLAPTQAAMDAWLTSSPFWAVGIYISGASRACREQPNLTPQWITTQLENGWRLLPITLGPQASCSTRFPRYGNDPVIDDDPANNYGKARAMGRLEANRAVAAAQDLGIDPGSTLWYDLEGYDNRIVRCRTSAQWFLSAWTKRLHALDYVSGVYSSAGSGLKVLDDWRVDPPAGYLGPDRVWIADWNGKADTASTYIRPDGWLPGNRMHQYRGGHNETWGGVTINIDSNWLDLGRGSTPPKAVNHCQAKIQLDFAAYPFLRPGDTGPEVTALQCLLRKHAEYDGELDGVYDAAVAAAVQRFRAEVGLPAGKATGKAVWVALTSQGRTSLVKVGARREMVRRLQRALNAAAAEKLTVSGVFDVRTAAAVKRYQDRRGLPESGVVTPQVWAALQSGKG